MKLLKSVVIICIVIIGVTFLSSPIRDFLTDNIADVYNTTRPLMLYGGGQKCTAELTAKNVQYAALGDIGTNECPILNAVRVTGFHKTQVSSPFTLSCPTASAVASWLDDIKVSSIQHMGTLNCRQQRGINFNSEHSYGTAIDISHLDSASVKDDWGKNNKNGRFLQTAAAAACNYFNNVLTPASNRLHHDHYHLDTGLGFGCNFNKVKQGAFIVLEATRNYLEVLQRP